MIVFNSIQFQRLDFFNLGKLFRINAEMMDPARRSREEVKSLLWTAFIKASPSALASFIVDSAKSLSRSGVGTDSDPSRLPGCNN